MLELFGTEFDELENQLSRILAPLRPSAHGFSDPDEAARSCARAWSVLKEHGWLGSDIDRDGDRHASRMRTYALFRNIGFHGVPGPFLGRGTFKSEFVSQLGRAGHDQVTPAAADDGCAVAWNGLPTADPEGITIRQGRLQGSLSHVVDGHGASSFLVVARDAEGQSRLFRIGKDDPGVATKSFITVDGCPAIALDCSRVDAAGRELGVPSAQLEDAQAAAWAAAAVAASAECAGLAQRLVADTTAYVRLRKQFGQPIGMFQVVQHALVDAYIASEESLSLALSGAIRMDAPDEERVAMAASVLSGAAERALDVARTAVQLHGAIGFTDELPVGAAFRRVTYLSRLLVPELELAASGIDA